jgi:hypothetical protein
MFKIMEEHFCLLYIKHLSYDSISKKPEILLLSVILMLVKILDDLYAV